MTQAANLAALGSTANANGAITGSVLQVVSATYATQTSTSSTTFADTGLTATITPKFSTSKILVLINHTECYRSAGNSNSSLLLNLCRNGSQIVQIAYSLGYTGTSLDQVFSFSSSYYDSPATTSATTYKTQFKNSVAVSQVVVQNNNTPSTITLLEIAQ